MERLFKPFSQVDSGLSRKFEGTGLGLAMVKLLAELHGGAVAVESAVGEGSCFTVWLPIRMPEAVLTSASAPGRRWRRDESGSAHRAGGGKTDFKSADLIRVQLEAEGFTVLHAASAEAALAVVTEQPLALITLDIMLPNMDGWEFLGRLKQLPDLRSIPVLIISIVADRNKGFALGAAAVMQKPISRRELYESLVDLGLFPRAPDRPLKVLVVDDDPKAVELIAVRIMGMAGTVLRAYGGRECDRRRAPGSCRTWMVLDLMMPEVSGFDVVAAASRNSLTRLTFRSWGHRQADRRRRPRQAEWLCLDNHGKGGVRRGPLHGGKSGGRCRGGRSPPDLAHTCRSSLYNPRGHHGCPPMVGLRSRRNRTSSPRPPASSWRWAGCRFCTCGYVKAVARYRQQLRKLSAPHRLVHAFTRHPWVGFYALLWLVARRLPPGCPLRESPCCWRRRGRSSRTRRS